MNYENAGLVEPDQDVAESIARLGNHRVQLLEQIGETIVGLHDVVEQILITLLCQGHCIIEGMPGLAKTRMISTTASALDLHFRRVQFTPDLMPADITGTDVLEEDHSTGRRIFRFIEGPLFGNVVLADEINRAPPKTQSALLEAMQERQVTVGGKTYQLPDPFFVMATQNPIEVEGTYPLPEAQLDRFLLKIAVSYPSREDEREICRRETTHHRATVPSVLEQDELCSMQSLVRDIVVSDHVYDAVLDLVRSTRPDSQILKQAFPEMVQWGAGPRASIALMLAAKARAALHGRFHVTTADVRAMALPTLRHRIVLTFNAEAAGIDSDHILKEVVSRTPSIHQEN